MIQMPPRTRPLGARPPSFKPSEPIDQPATKRSTTVRGPRNCSFKYQSSSTSLNSAFFPKNRNATTSSVAPTVSPSSQTSESLISQDSTNTNFSSVTSNNENNINNNEYPWNNNSQTKGIIVEKTPSHNPSRTPSLSSSSIQNSTQPIDPTPKTDVFQEENNDPFYDESVEILHSVETPQTNKASLFNNQTKNTGALDTSSNLENIVIPRYLTNPELEIGIPGSLIPSFLPPNVIRHDKDFGNNTTENDEEVSTSNITFVPLHILPYSPLNFEAASWVSLFLHVIISNESVNTFLSLYVFCWFMVL